MSEGKFEILLNLVEPQEPATPIVDTEALIAIPRDSTEETIDMSRRDFFRGGAKLMGAGLAVAVGAATPETASAIENSPVSESLKNIFELETQHAHYKIVYSLHSIETNPRILEGVDAVLLEMPNDFKTEQDVIHQVNFELKGQAGTSKYGLSAETQYRQLFQAIAETQQPVYFVDVDDSSPAMKDLEAKSLDRMPKLGLLETGAGIYLSAAGIQDLKKSTENKKPTRRKFMTGLSKLLGGLYLGSHIPEVATMSFDDVDDEGSIRRKINKSFIRLNDAIHPEIRGNVLNARNMLMAQKADAIAQQFEEDLGKKPTVAIIVGSEHAGIENDLQLSEEKRIQALKEIFGNEFKNQSKIIRLVINKNHTSQIDFLNDLAFK